MKSIFKYLAAAVLAVAGLAGGAQAEIELSFYGGTQSSPHSRITGSRADGSTYSNLIGWQGKSFSMPPYYGARAIWWRDSDIGWGLEVTHAKAYAPAAEMPAGFTRLEFTDGHNIVTLNVMKRWPGQWWSGKLTPYVGAGLGAAIPHVDITENGNRTYGYQVTGPAAKLMAGVKYDLNHRWAVFSEYQFSWTENSADLAGGGSLEGRILTNALNVGVALQF